MKRSVLILGVALVLFLLGAVEAEAIPAFARKYAASCQTCHVAYPKLNAFGTAFRLRGYRMPGETEDMVKQKPVVLGAPAWKRLWPKAIWPSDLPAHIPLAARVNLPTVWSSTAEESDRVRVENDFQFPARMYFQGAGTFGQLISYFAKLEISRVESAEIQGPEIVRSSEIEVDFEHAEIHFNNIAGPPVALNLKVGRFEPEMVGISFSHMRPLTDANYNSMFSYQPIALGGGTAAAGGGHGHGGNGGIGLPSTVEGIELYGVAKSRFFWNVGLANGLGPGFGNSYDGNSLKDFYGRLSYKFGGIGFDGTRGDSPVPAGGEKPWRDNSVTIGVFAYQGDGKDVIFTLEEHADEHGDEHGDEEGDEHGDEEGDEHDEEGDGHDEEGDGHDEEGDEHGDEEGDEHEEGAAFVPIEDESFLRYGVDIHWWHQNLHLFGAYVWGEDDLTTYDSEAWALSPGTLVPLGTNPFDYEAFFVEADYVFLPWLIGAFRYEYLDPANVEANDYEWGIANMTTLIRQNVKVYLEWQQDLDESKNYAVILGVDFAF